ncbi:MAG: peptidase S8, partial [Nocardioides sp.]|nr:peptidase S8 [Nocardioides sp.]
ENLGDGFYWLFSSLTGSHTFEATYKGYKSVSANVDVAADSTTRQDFELSAGHVVVDRTSISVQKRLGKSPVTKKFKVTNDGEVPVNLDFTEGKGGFEMLGADGSRTNRKKLLAKEGAPLQENKVDTSFAKQAKSSMTTNKKPDVSGPQEDPWTDIADFGATVMDNRTVYADGVAYSIAGGDGTASTNTMAAYDPSTLTWTSKSPLPEARNAVAAGVVDDQVIVSGGWADAGPSASTWSYDPAADAWTAMADSPLSLAASGQAVVDDKVYVVGGCTTASCTPMSSKVAAYDPASDSWTQLADYPVAAAFISCGGIDGMVYCAGGNDGADGTASAYVYDPGADAWTAIPDAPSDSWASQYAVANGTLVINGGVQATAVTNRTFAYDPAAEEWIDLPNSNTARYRGSASCGVYKVGGSLGGFTATVDSEMLPGMEDCGGSAADVEWMEVSPAVAILAPGQSVKVKVTMDPNVAQPGTYTASVGIKEDTPFKVEPVAVTMPVKPPKRWGKLAGTVSGTTCDGATAPIPGATVQANSGDDLSWTFETATDGTYARWFDAIYSPLQLIGAKDGFMPMAQKVKLKKGRTANGDFNLKEPGC